MAGAEIVLPEITSPPSSVVYQDRRAKITRLGEQESSIRLRSGDEISKDTLQNLATHANKHPSGPERTSHNYSRMWQPL